MNNKVVLSLFFGAVVGCVANEAVRAGTVTAQPRPGEFRECVSYGLNDEGELADLGAEAKSIAGWTPVGGTSYGVVLCR
ncbi:MAG: hypothetical protein ACI9KE_002860 [Polyangiales bacterium]|jgi:hypothetical protein